MTDARTRPTRSTRSTALLLAVRSAAVLLVVLLGCGVLPGQRDAAPPRIDTADSGPEPYVAGLVRRHHCSFHGLGDDVIPGSALLRAPSGLVRWVSFDRGWAAYTGAAAGTLVAVCRDPLLDR